jgi:hypothetical protein
MLRAGAGGAVRVRELRAAKDFICVVLDIIGLGEGRLPVLRPEIRRSGVHYHMN